LSTSFTISGWLWVPDREPATAQAWLAD